MCRQCSPPQLPLSHSTTAPATAISANAHCLSGHCLSHYSQRPHLIHHCFHSIRLQPHSLALSEDQESVDAAHAEQFQREGCTYPVHGLLSPAELATADQLLTRLVHERPKVGVCSDVHVSCGQRWEINCCTVHYAAPCTVHHAALFQPSGN